MEEGEEEGKKGRQAHTPSLQPLYFTLGTCICMDGARVSLFHIVAP